MNCLYTKRRKLQKSGHRLKKRRWRWRKSHFRGALPFGGLLLQKSGQRCFLKEAYKGRLYGYAYGRILNSNSIIGSPISVQNVLLKNACVNRSLGSCRRGGCRVKRHLSKSRTYRKTHGSLPLGEEPICAGEMGVRLEFMWRYKGLPVWRKLQRGKKNRKLKRPAGRGGATFAWLLLLLPAPSKPPLHALLS